MTLRLGVLVSGSGTNLQAVIDEIEAGRLDAEVALVISNREFARGLDRARKHGIEAIWLDPTSFDTLPKFNEKIRDEFLRHGVDIVVMAGYMKLLGKEVLHAYPHKVVNLHPALLPSFPGASGIKDAFDYGVKVTGVTVHFADEVFDRGPIIAQEAIVIAEGETIESLEAKIHEVEHRILPMALQLIAEDRVSVQGRKVVIAG